MIELVSECTPARRQNVVEPACESTMRGIGWPGQMSTAPAGHVIVRARRGTDTNRAGMVRTRAALLVLWRTVSLFRRNRITEHTVGSRRAVGQRLVEVGPVRAVPHLPRTGKCAGLVFHRAERPLVKTGEPAGIAHCFTTPMIGSPNTLFVQAVPSDNVL